MKCTNKNCVGGVITFNGQTGKPCKKCNPTPKKEATNKSITIYRVGKYRDDVSTINRAEAALLLIELYKALYTDTSITSIIMPIIIDKTK